MYSSDIEHVCSYCFFSEKAKGLTEHIYCNKRKEYRRCSADVCEEYSYDIMKRPVRRRPAFKTKTYDFSID